MAGGCRRLAITKPGMSLGVSWSWSAACSFVSQQSQQHVNFSLEALARRFTDNAPWTRPDRPLHPERCNLRLRSSHRDRFRLLPPVRLCGHPGSPRAIAHVLRRYLHAARCATSSPAYAVISAHIPNSPDLRRLSRPVYFRGDLRQQLIPRLAGDIARCAAASATGCLIRLERRVFHNATEDGAEAVSSGHHG